MEASAVPFPYRLAATDLDGTLLGPHKEISPENLAAVRALQARGAQIVVASGRRHQNSIRFYQQLGLDTLLMSCAGALVKQPETGEIIREVPLSTPDAAGLVADGQRDGYTVVYYHRDGLYVSRRDHWSELYESRVGERAEDPPGNLNDLRGEGALKIVWYGEPGKLRDLRARAVEAYAGRVTVLATDPENLEFSAAEGNKAAALAAIADYYGVSQADTLAFGDGENDAPMLGWAGLGVAVDRANDAAKAAAGLVGPQGAPETSFARAVQAVFERTSADR